MEQRLIDADALREEWLYENGTFEPNDVLDSIDCQPTIAVVPVVHGQFVKNETGVNRHCTACGAYLEDREYENHTVRFCYYCGAKMKGANDE